MSSVTLNGEQQEIVELLCGELGELLAIDTAALESSDVEEQQHFLREYAVSAEHIGNALSLSGLQALGDVCQFLTNNFNALCEQATVVDEQLVELLPLWPVHLLNYLHGLSDGGEADAAAQDVLDYLCQSAWPSPMSADGSNDLKRRLSESVVGIEEDEIEAYPSIATAEMASLDVPADVRRELLDGLLVELPEQSSGFEASVSRYLQSGDIHDLSQAQRIAHTIKGAANVVGVKGVANLMHFMEDLLETAAKPNRAIPPKFDEVLVEASDSLATMTEFLGGLAPLPTDTVTTLQKVLDWVHLIKGRSNNNDQQFNDVADHAEAAGDRVDTSQAAAPVDQASSTSSQKQQQAPSTVDDEEEKHFLNVTEKTAQQLLRIAGESQIANTQVMAQIEAMTASLALAERYHRQIKTMANELEALIQTQSALRSASIHYKEGQYKDNELDPLEMDRYSELHSFSHQLLELTTDSYEAIGHVEEQISELSAIAYSHKQLNADNQQLLLALRMVPVETMVARFNRCVRQACRLTGKNAQLNVEGASLLIDSHVLNRIADPIMHLLRNAVDHGLSQVEGSDEGIEARQGSISLTFKQLGETITVECRDSGRGLNYGSIGRKAVNLGLLDEQQVNDVNLLNQIIFLPGFSTRDNVSQTSGRGIGLDAVTEEIKQLKGTIAVTSSDQGTSFVITVPTSILTGHALLVRCSSRSAQNIVSIVSRSVEQVIYIEPEQLERQDTNIFYNYQDQQLPVYPLSELIGIHYQRQEEFSALIVCRKPDGVLIAVAVESVIASQDLVIKPLNKYAYHPPGVVGATILGNGTVSPVIDLQELPGLSMSAEELARLQSQRAKWAELEKQAFKEPPRAIVVDDSLSARRSLAQFVSDLGMEVYTAKDGFEAINLVNDKKPSLMLVDLEMPRMNGLELTAHLRADDDTRDIPIIMITSRSTQKHRDMAQKAGVSTYLNKPWSEEDLLNCIQTQMSLVS